MDDIGKSMCAAILVLGAVAIGIILACGVNDSRFIKAGYTREILPGSSMAIWVKR